MRNVNNMNATAIPKNLIPYHKLMVDKDTKFYSPTLQNEITDVQDFLYSGVEVLTGKVNGQVMTFSAEFIVMTAPKQKEITHWYNLYENGHVLKVESEAGAKDSFDKIDMVVDYFSKTIAITE